MNINQNQNQQSQDSSIEEILEKGDKKEIRALFSFDSEDTDEEVYVKFELWSRFFYPKFFSFDDAEFHEHMCMILIRLYRGSTSKIHGNPIWDTILKLWSWFKSLFLKYFVNIAFRGAAKTTKTKLFVAFVIANDSEHIRKYIKVLSADRGNAVQIVTDVYNLLIRKAVQYYYPEIFQRTSSEKRSETMSVFTTFTGVKMQADSVGVDQRGDIQEEARPDFLWFDDFETRKTLRSAVTTQMIWDNMEEARTGLSKEGVALYNCNYVSERGNVHRLVEKKSPDMFVLITPIKTGRTPTWPEAYTIEEIDTIEANAEDFAGEYLCEPSAGADVYFDRATIDNQVKKTPIRDIAGFKIFHEYSHSHRYGLGADVAGGVELDSSATVIIDFSTTPSKVVATFANNTIDPTGFGDEIKSQADRYGACIVAVENNKFEQTIGRLRHLNYDNLYFTEVKETRAGLPPKTRTFGWNTNMHTKNKILTNLKSAVADGHLELSDPMLIAELRSYSRDDFMENAVDPRLTTRHFDLLIACAIAYEMRNYAEVKQSAAPAYVQPEYERAGLE